MWIHDVAERLRIRRKAIARDANLDDSFDVGTYPSSSEEVVVHVNKGNNNLLSILIAGALGAGIPTVGFFALRENPPPPLKESPPPVIAPSTDTDTRNTLRPYYPN